MNSEKNNHSFNSDIRGNAKTNLFYAENINEKDIKHSRKRIKYHDNYSSGTIMFETCYRFTLI